MYSYAHFFLVIGTCPGMNGGNPRDYQSPPTPALSECHDTIQQSYVEELYVHLCTNMYSTPETPSLPSPLPLQAQCA